VTAETIPHAAIRTMRQLAAPCRFRVIRDSEGWPMIPGRYGQIEYHDSRNLAVWTDRPRGQGDEAYALRLLGEIASQGDPLDAETAEAHYRQALAFATELGMRPLAAHCHLGLGTLYRRIGKREPAQEHLSTAATMYREMGMRFWLAKSEQEATASD
jgi:tetratricopeptide (TPR) repeat protein